MKLSFTAPACPRPRACALGLRRVRVRSRRLRCNGLGLSRADAASLTGRRMFAEPVRYLTKSLLGSRFVHPDHLGTPRVITASTALAATTGTGITSPQTVNKAVWRWDSDPFGSNATANSAPNENPNTLSQVVGTATLPYLFGFDLAFPGQKRDRETGKHYNYFRDYDPSNGRYVEPDPIGLDGGWNTYGYVKAKPNVAIDPKGLALWSCLRSCCGRVANHAYLYDDASGTCCGDPGPSRDSTNFIKTCKEKGPNGDTCTLVSLNADDAKKALSCCDRRTRNTFYWPTLNDCHNRVEECINELGFIMTTSHSKRRFQACDSCYKREGTPTSLGPMP